MYRDYEDARALERRLCEWRDKYETAKALGASMDTLRDIHEYVAELEERVNFAWQDDEF